jgi:dUTP pyrophosphatase
VRLQVRRLDADLPLPAYGRVDDAGLDLLAADDVTLQPHERAAVRTGLAVAIPVGFAGFVHARSGRALREGLGLVNAPGVIDSGYRGEIKVILVNLDVESAVHIKRGDKIAQLVVQRIEPVEFDEVEALTESERGEGGFGSTGN